MEGRWGQNRWEGRYLSWHINCLEMMAVFRVLRLFLSRLRDQHVLVRSDNTAVVSYLNHQGGLRSRPLYKLARQILLWSQGRLLYISLHPRTSESGSRCPVEAGTEPRGVETPPRGGGADMEEVWSGGSGSVRVPGNNALPTVVFAHTSSPIEVGCHDTGVAEASPVCLSSDCSAPGSSGEGAPESASC